MKNILRAIAGIFLIGVSILMLINNLFGRLNVFKSILDLIQGENRGYSLEDYSEKGTQLVLGVLLITASIYLIKYSKGLLKPKPKSDHKD